MAAAMLLLGYGLGVTSTIILIRYGMSRGGGEQGPNFSLPQTPKLFSSRKGRRTPKSVSEYDQWRKEQNAPPEMGE